MDKKRIIKILNSLILGNILVLIFLVPLFFSIFFVTDNVFELNKSVLFHILTLFLLLFTLIRFFLGDLTWPKFRLSWLYILPPIALILVFVLSSLTSINPFLSLWGLYIRKQGLISQFYYLLFYFLLIINVKKHHLNLIIYTIFSSAFIVSIYGLLQVSGIDFFLWIDSSSAQHRAASSIGQCNFLASYLLLIIPISLYIFHIARNYWVRFIAFIGILLNFSVLFFTYSRGGWVGFVLGAMATIMLVTLIKKQYLKLFLQKKYVILCIILVIVFSFALSIAVDKKVDFFNLKYGTVNVRMNFWQASVKAIKEKPILGYGLETQGEIFSAYYKKNWAINGEVNDYPDRAHNIIFDILLTSGFVGLIAYFFWWAVIIRFVKENIEKRNQAVLSSLLFFSLANAYGSFLFSFDTTATAVYIWLLLALIVVIHKSDEQPAPNPIERRFLIANLTKTVFFGLFLIAIISQIKLEFNSIIADYYFREFRTAIFLENDYGGAINIYEEIKKLKVPEKHYDLNFVVLLSDRFSDLPSLELKQKAEKMFLQIDKNFTSQNYTDLYLKSRLYYALASQGSEDYFNKAKYYLDAVSKYSPEIPELYEIMAKLYCQKNDFIQAEAYSNKALENLPDIKDPLIFYLHRQRIELEKYFIYKNLGNCAYKLKSYELAGKYFKLAYVNNTNDIVLLKQIADTYFLRHNINEAIKYNLHGWQLSLRDYSWPLSLAMLYQEKGDKTKALFYINEALRLAPDNNLIIKLKNSLDKK